jgi:hypothetical protein
VDIGNSEALMRRSFLVAPLLPIGSAQEVKFSGNRNFTPNGDRFGDTMDAYTHHAFIDSDYTFLPADLQGIREVSPDS